MGTEKLKRTLNINVFARKKKYWGKFEREFDTPDFLFKVGNDGREFILSINDDYGDQFQENDDYVTDANGNESISEAMYFYGGYGKEHESIYNEFFVKYDLFTAKDLLKKPKYKLQDMSMWKKVKKHEICFESFRDLYFLRHGVAIDVEEEYDIVKYDSEGLSYDDYTEIFGDSWDFTPPSEFLPTSEELKRLSMGWEKFNEGNRDIEAWDLVNDFYNKWDKRFIEANLKYFWKDKKKFYDEELNEIKPEKIFR